MRFAIVASRYNDQITSPLARAAEQSLKSHAAAAIETFEVPGAWEIPVAALHAARSGRFEAIICIGCVIRGDTPHFDYVAGEAASGCARVALDTGIPVAFGVLTTDNLEQALDRAGGKVGNKGAEAALAAIEMALLIRRIRS